MFPSNGSFRWPADAGLLLVGHGSREPAGVREFLDTHRRIARISAGLPAEPCFLECASPAIAEGFQSLEGRGARRIVVVPVLLFAAGHAKRDIPAAVAEAAAGSSTTNVLQSDHLGCHEAVLRLSVLRYQQAVADRTVSDEDTVLVMVGRGSHDASATDEMRRFVALRAEATGVRHVRTCFVAMAEPRLSDALDEAASGGAGCVVVQPHLLFGGVLLDRIGKTVESYAVRYPRTRWITTGHLGPSDQLAAAVLDRAAERWQRDARID